MTKYQARFEDYLRKHCSDALGELYQQKEYALSGGGHRIRPQLVLAWCDYCGGDWVKALPIALAVEFIHTASLIHDDLPCMDNADERRGRPSLHKMYAENTAVLTGDRLVAEAFYLICSADLPNHSLVKAVEFLSISAQEMADGQALELSEPAYTLGQFEDIYYGKTASLLAVSCGLGALAAGCTDQEFYEAFCFGCDLGMAYQYLDDIKDEDGVLSIIGEETARRNGLEYLGRCVVEETSDAGTFLNSLARSLV